MTRDETIAAIAVMQAFVDGNTVQFKSPIDDSWSDLAADQLSETWPVWNWCGATYRVKPEPRVIFATAYVREGSPYGGIYRSKDEATEWLNSGGEVIKFVEVME